MIGFRVDANEQIATGHLMRCIAIAEACRRQGEKCLFLLAENKETERLKEHNLPFYILNTCWNDLESELPMLQQILQKERITKLVVDSYQVTEIYLRSLNEQVPVLYVDDLELHTYDVNAVLHYSEWQEDYAYREKYLLKNTKVLSGMQYVPLRDEFSPDEQGKIREKSILITTGGTDPFNITGTLLQRLKKQEELREYAFHVIVGSMNQHEAELKLMEEKDTRIFLHKNVKNMSYFMKTCRFAVSAGGTTLFELCACGIPTVCFSFADNQQRFVNELDKKHIMISAGDARTEKDFVGKICDSLMLYHKNEEMALSYAKRMQALVDGRGTERIAKYLCAKRKKFGQIHLRKAQSADAELLYEWKNDPVCIQNSLSKRRVYWEEHQKWFSSMLDSDKAGIFVVEVGGDSAAQIRLDKVGVCGTISYSIAKEYRGYGLGTEMMQLIEKKATEMGIYELRAVVLRYNIASRKVFLQAGYQESMEGDNLLYTKKMKINFSYIN